MDGVVLSLNVAVGSYVSSQGAYNTYTGGYQPVLVMGSMLDDLAVRCYVDEILIQRLPKPKDMQARMYIHGSTVSVPLQFERMQPYVTPKIELSDQRTERVDLRVLPVIFRFKRPPELTLYPGQLVDVYIGQQPPPDANKP
jgi:HlyD family secretion protein